MTPSVNTESESMVLLIRFMKKHCYSVKSASFHLLKKAFLLSICTENMIVLSPSRIMSATYAITPSWWRRNWPCTCTRNIMVSLLSKSHATCVLFTFHLSRVLKNHINRKHLGILKMFECNKCDFSLKTTKKEATLTCELCDYRTFNAQYLKGQMQALCQAAY